MNNPLGAPSAGALAGPGAGLGLDDATPLAREAADHVQLAARVERTQRFDRPADTRIFVVANQKGGVGKTTTTVNVAAALAMRGLQVLVVDLDPQGNASTALNIPHAEGTSGVYEAIVEGDDIVDLVQTCPEHPTLDVLPASIDLAGAEIELVSLVARESRLDKSLQSYLDVRERAGRRVDYVLIDCPPSLGLLTVNAMVAGREVLIPIQCEYYALEGLGQLLRNIDLVRAHLNPRLDVSTILLTMFDARTNLSAGVAQEVREHFQDKVLRTAIPRSVRISEAPSYQQTVLTYDPTSSGALSYLEAAREITVMAKRLED
jgi:chromosome partitioning protein